MNSFLYSNGRVALDVTSSIAESEFGVSNLLEIIDSRG